MKKLIFGILLLLCSVANAGIVSGVVGGVIGGAIANGNNNGTNSVYVVPVGHIAVICNHVNDNNQCLYNPPDSSWPTLIPIIKYACKSLEIQDLSCANFYVFKTIYIFSNEGYLHSVIVEFAPVKKS